MKKRLTEEQQKYIRHQVPNPKKAAFVDLPISHEEYLKARLQNSYGKVGEMTGRFWMKSDKWGSFTDEVDIERTYTFLGNWDKDEEEAKENRKKKKERDKDDDDEGCCDAWYCCPFRCSWKMLCSFLG